jgi:hypothetical protein
MTVAPDNIASSVGWELFSHDADVGVRMSLAEAVQMPLLAMLKRLRCRARVAQPPTEAAKRKAPDGPGSSGASEGDHLQVES